MIDSVSVIIILITLVLSAFFSGFEIAYVSSNKVHIEILKKQEGVIANVLTKLTRRPSKLLATMLVGNNVALVCDGQGDDSNATSFLSECGMAYGDIYACHFDYCGVYAKGVLSDLRQSTTENICHSCLFLLCALLALVGVCHLDIRLCVEGFL